MNDARQLVDPTAELAEAQRERVARPDSIEGLTVGLLDISKPRGNVFLDRLEAKLTADGATVERYQKPTFTRVAPEDIKRRISEQCNLVIEALAD